MGHPRPIYLLSGDSYHHRKTRDPLLRAMLSETGKVRPSVAYIGAASSDDPGFYGVLQRLFERTGAGTVTLAPLCGPLADLPRARQALEMADVIFLTEGDVDLGMTVLRQNDMVPLLRQRYLDGAVFSGFSAGRSAKQPGPLCAGRTAG